MIMKWICFKEGIKGIAEVFPNTEIIICLAAMEQSPEGSTNDKT